MLWDPTLNQVAWLEEQAERSAPRGLHSLKQLCHDGKLAGEDPAELDAVIGWARSALSDEFVVNLMEEGGYCAIPVNQLWGLRQLVQVLVDRARVEGVDKALRHMASRARKSRDGLFVLRAALDYAARPGVRVRMMTSESNAEGWHPDLHVRAVFRGEAFVECTRIAMPEGVSAYYRELDSVTRRYMSPDSDPRTFPERLERLNTAWDDLWNDAKGQPRLQGAVQDARERREKRLLNVLDRKYDQVAKALYEPAVIAIDISHNTDWPASELPWFTAGDVIERRFFQHKQHRRVSAVDIRRWTEDERGDRGRFFWRRVRNPYNDDLHPEFPVPHPAIPESAR